MTPPGAYRLRAVDGVVTVTGAGPAGVFYGLQTLRQLETARSPAPGGDQPRDVAAFEARLASHLDRLAALGINYRPLDGPTSGQAHTWQPASDPQG